jgi:hypothetical protein
LPVIPKYAAPQALTHVEQEVSVSWSLLLVCSLVFKSFHRF